MTSILQIWTEFHVDDALENEVVKLILEKVIAIREKQTKKITQELIKQLEQPHKFKQNKKFETNPRSNRAKLRPLDISARVENAINGGEQREGFTKGKSTFKMEESKA